MTEVHKSRINGMEYDSEGFRMATPPEIADYKSRRLKSSSIADLGCGIGIQAIYFSNYFESVAAVEKDEMRSNIASKNFSRFNFGKIRLIKGDALDRNIIKMVGDVDTVHSDPSRLKSTEKWSLEMLSPNPLKIIQKYSAETFTFDLPIQLKPDKIPGSWEREYVSVKGEPKRIIAYMGKGMKYEVSAITLPSERRIIGRPDIDRDIIFSDSVYNYIYDLDQTVFLAGLLPEFVREYGAIKPILADSQRIFLTSEKLFEDDFLLNTYEVNGHTDEPNRLKDMLSDNNFGRVILRYRIPDNIYYSTKKILEKGAKGNETGYIFKIGEMYYLGRKIKRRNS